MPAPMGHPNYDTEGLAGRPKKYTEDFINKQADDLLEWLKNSENIFFEDFLLDQNINPNRMSEWALVNERFLGAYEIAKHRQLSRLKKGAVLKEFDSGFTKFLMINNHGYSDKTETKISGDPIDPLTFVLGSIPSSKELVKDGKE